MPRDVKGHPDPPAFTACATRTINSFWSIPLKKARAGIRTVFASVNLKARCGRVRLVAANGRASARQAAAAKTELSSGGSVSSRVSRRP